MVADRVSIKKVTKAKKPVVKTKRKRKSIAMPKSAARRKTLDVSSWYTFQSYS